MDMGECKDNEQALASFQFLKAHSPFRFSGTWYVASIKGTGVAYRSTRDLVKRWRRDEPERTELSYLTVKPA